jgi:hypothetical protein
MPTLQKDFSVPAVPIDLQSRLNLDGSTQADRNLAVEEADSGCFQIASRQIPGRKNRPKAGASNGRVRPSRQSTSPVMLPQHSLRYLWPVVLRCPCRRTRRGISAPLSLAMKVEKVETATKCWTQLAPWA